jgi:hypothetical protein
MQDVFHLTGEKVEYRHSNGEISTVRISTAAMGTIREKMPTTPGSVGCCTTEGSVYIQRSKGNSGGKHGLFYSVTRWPMAFDSQ